MNTFIASSANPEELSLTIKGAIVAIVPMVGLILKASGHSIQDADIQSVTDNLSNLVILVGSAASSLLMLVGAVRKVIVNFSGK